MARQKLSEPVQRTAVYLTTGQRRAVESVQYHLPRTRGIEIETKSDAVAISVVEFSKILESEYRVKSAASRPRM